MNESPAVHVALREPQATKLPLLSQRLPTEKDIRGITFSEALLFLFADKSLSELFV